MATIIDVMYECAKSFPNAVKLAVPQHETDTGYCYPFGFDGPAGKIVERGIPRGYNYCEFDSFELVEFLASYITRSRYYGARE